MRHILAANRKLTGQGWFSPQALSGVVVLLAAEDKIPLIDPDSDNGIVISPRSVGKLILTSCFAKSRAITPLGVTLV